MTGFAVRASWRTGRRVGRTIYAMVLSVPSDADELIGVMDTPALAAEAVRAHNRSLAEVHAIPCVPTGDGACSVADALHRAEMHGGRPAP